MFVSSTDQQNPSSSSSSFLHLTNTSDEFGQSQQLSSFSIRDYTFSNRTKNFKKSWPFSSRSLQLCLKHGLSDPLPPIHTPEALSLKKQNITHVETISYTEKLGSNQTLVKAKEGSENGLLASGSKSKIQVAIANKNPRKKIGLMVKPGAVMETDSIALRTCPICKTFSSASNTTLNAHIDQCLSVDAGEQPISKPNKPKVKPKMKVKSMIDIYASAKACTLEDLDKRNGTKWATVSRCSNRVVSNDNKPELSSKGKKPSVSRVVIDEDASGIGPVYINDKGQKLRILSEFNKKTSGSSREHEDVSEKKSSIEGKGNKTLRKRLHKYRKQVPQSKKLLVSKSNASEISEFRRENPEEGRGMEKAETPGRSQRRILNKRMLTKSRSSRYRNLKGTDDDLLWDQPSESGHSLSGDDPLVLRGSTHVSTDLSETVSSPLKGQNSWRVCWESQVSGKSLALSRRKDTKSCPRPADKAFEPEAKGIVKLKKARLDFSESEDIDEDMGKWESETTQERELTDSDDNGGSDKVEPSSIPSISREDDDDYESYEEIGNNKGGDDDMLDSKTDEFESMVYEKTECETAEQGGTFVEVDPIPIPGPPGSFLPSPWDMGTDAVENHGNSSVITSQVHSSQDLSDRNSSESLVSAISNFPPPETHISIDMRPSRFRDNDQSCCCQRKEDTTFGQPPPHMIQQDLHFKNKSVTAVNTNSNPVFRLMGKDLMVISQREEEPSHNEPTSHQCLDSSKSQQQSPLHRPYGGNGLSLDTSTRFCDIP